ncbi:MAG: membrane protein insertase YidC, partial [Alphaproteobacteria bacterium]|nr:membrane protein insertase YidC [Alphaproteobacteria bacterium]
MVQYLDNNSGFAQWASMQNQKKPEKKFSFFKWALIFLLAWWVMGLWMKPQNTEIANTAPVTVEQSSATKQTVAKDEIDFEIQGLRISNIALKNHKKDATSNENIALLNAENNFIEIGFVSTDTVVPNINTAWKNTEDLMSWNNGKQINFSRKVSVEGYTITITDTIQNNSATEINVAPYIQIVKSTNEKMSGVVETGGVVYANSKLDYTHWNTLNKKSVAYSTVRGSLGFAEQYWETIASIDLKDQTISLKKSGDLYFAQTNAAPIKVAPKASIDVNTYLFTGPRMSNLLNAAADKIPGIAETMDYGWFWF